MSALRERLRSAPVFEALLVVLGAVLVAVGAGPARADPGALQIALYAAVLLSGALVLWVIVGADADRRRALALETVLMLVVAVPFTRIPSAGELIVSISAVVVAVTVAGLAGGGRPPRGTWLAAALLLVLAASTAVAPDRYGLLRYAPFAVVFAAVFLLFGGAGRPVRRRVLRFAVLLALVEAAVGIVEPFLRFPTLWAPGKINAEGVVKALHNPLLPGLVRAQATMGHPLALGVLLVAAVALLVRNAVELPARVRIPAAVVLGLGLLASGSRNSVVLAILLAVVFVPRWRLGRRAVVAIGAMLGVAVVVWFVASPLLDVWLASGSATHRAGALAALPGLLFGQHPLPVLFGNGWASSARMFTDGMLQNDGLRAVDDEFVLLLSQGGLVAVALYVVLLVLALRRAERSLLPLVLVLVVTSFVFDVLAWPSSAALTALALAAAPARARPAVPHRRTSAQRRRTAAASSARSGSTPVRPAP